VARLALVVLTLIAAVGLSVNLIWPPSGYGYEIEQVLLVAFGVVTFLVSRYSVSAAVTVYCSFALLPVLGMLEYHHDNQGGGWAKLTAVPFIGVLVVGFLTRNALAVIVYTIVATGANCAIGSIYDNSGTAGALVAITIIAGTAMTVWCLCEARKTEALDKLDIITRGLEDIL
jgi:hypothetical protein